MPIYSRLTDKEELATQVNSLAGKLTRAIFEDIEDDLKNYCGLVPPVPEHYAVYSPHLLGIILRATSEIDSQLSSLGVELAGGEKAKRTIKNHIELEPDLQLAQYRVAVKFSGHELQPFASFPNQDSPDWWKVNNQIKHDRLNSITSATLYNALSAVSALYVLLHRQYGGLFFPAPMALREDGQQIALTGTKLFRITARPES